MNSTTVCSPTASNPESRRCKDAARMHSNLNLSPEAGRRLGTRNATQGGMARAGGNEETGCVTRTCLASGTRLEHRRLKISVLKVEVARALGGDDQHTGNRCDDAHDKERAGIRAAPVRDAPDGVDAFGEH